MASAPSRRLQEVACLGRTELDVSKSLHLLDVPLWKVFLEEWFKRLTVNGMHPMEGVVFCGLL